MATPTESTAAAKASAAKGKKKGPKKEKKNIPHALATVQASFNNTIVSITDQQGNVLAWSSAGRIGFKGSRKGTPFAAQLAAGNAAADRPGERRAFAGRQGDGTRAPAARARSAPSPQRASTSGPSRTRRPSPTTAAGRGSGGGCKTLGVRGLFGL